jgi:putative ABC transport system permease protein
MTRSAPPPSATRPPAWRRYLRFWGPNVGADVRDELQFHLDMRAREFEAQGMEPHEARRAALERFGDLGRVDAALQSHDRRVDRTATVRQFTMTVGADVWHAGRALRRAPGFATAAVLCLALGTGATATVFAVVNALLLRPLAVQHPDNLVVIATTSSGMTLPGDNSYQNYLDIQGTHAVLEDAAASLTDAFSIRAGNQTDLRPVQAVSENYWPMLGVRPVLGRTFTPDEARAHAPLAVIGYRYWQQAFGGAPDAVGRAIDVDGIPLTIAGVAPRDFTGAQSMIEPDVWVPVTLLHAIDPSNHDQMQRRAGGGFRIIGRLRNGVSLATAQSALNVLATQLQHQYPADDEGKRFVVQRELRARPDLAVTDLVPRVAAVFMALTALVLLIACANVASLMLARANGRRTELAIRSALGARRARIVQQLLTESVVIAVSGGVAGVLLALGAARWFSAIHIASGIPVHFDVRLDWRVLAVTLGAVLMAAVLSAAGPALRSSDPSLSDTLKHDTRATGTGVHRQRFRVGLVAAQIAVSFVLLVAAGLLVRSMRQAHSLDLGFRRDHAFMATVDVSLARYDSARGKTFYRALLARATQIPGVRAAGLASTVPLGTSHNDIDVYSDLPALVQERGHTHVEVVSVTPGYLDAMGIRLLQGRDLTSRDDSSAPRVIVVNAATAARLWPGMDPVGQRVRFAADGPEIQVVGVAQTVTSTFVGERPHPLLYVPFAQRYRSEMTLHLQTEGDPAQVEAPVYASIASLDAALTPFAVKTMTEHLERGIAFTPIRLAATLATAIGLLGLVQALIGLYAVVAYSVAQREREIGIRMAMGATSRDILGGVIREGMVLTGAGLSIGFLASLAATGVLRSLLIGISVRDPMTFGVLAVVLATVTLAACGIPAVRGARLPPADTLRGGG